MQNIWTAFNGSSQYWTGSNICNSTDYTGVTCDATLTWPIKISLNSKGLVGYISPSVGDLINLTAINLAGNQLTGSIPTTFGHITSLAYLSLNNNELSGPLPDSIGNLTSLIRLDVTGNHLSGSIPSTIGNLKSLQNLMLGYNQLTTIPEAIGGLSSLQILYLNSNQLNGSIPYSIGNLLRVNYLTLSGNQLKGTIPDSIGNLTSLTTIYLGSNRFTGSLSERIINLPALIDLDLSNNLLDGIVPGRDNSLASLVTLSLNNNQLKSVGYVPVTKTCSLSGNAFPCYPPLNVSSICNGSVSYLTCTTTTASTSTIGSSSSISSSIISSSVATSSETSSVQTTTGIDRTNVSSVIQNLLDNDTRISVEDAKNVLDSPLHEDVEIVQLISAVVLALLRNTSTTSFEYNTRDVSVKLQTYNTTILDGRESVSNKIANSSIAVTLPVSVFSSQQQVSVSVALSSISYNPFESVYNETIYSPVIGVSVYAQGKEIDVRGVDQLINITMGSITSIPSGYEGVCQYWNETHSLWSKDGCSLVVEADVTICQCTHLTNFSIGIQQKLIPTERVADQPTEKGSNKTKLVAITVCFVLIGLPLVLVVSFLVYRRMYRYNRDDTEAGLFFTTVDTEGIEFEKMIGEGKRGQVWKSIYKETTVVAVKKFIEGIYIDKEQTLHHPNIVQYLGRNLSERYIVMEWMNDGTLYDFLSSQPQPTLEAMLSICQKVSDALSYIASQGLVHISVVPNKILLNGMTAKLSCLSCTVAESSLHSPEMSCFYTAPEVIEEKRYRASGHVYNVGVLLWSMVTYNHHLYDAAGEVESEVLLTVDETMDERVAELIVECTKRREEERPSLKELTKRMATCSLDEDLFMCGTSPNMSTQCSVKNGTCATTSMDAVTSDDKHYIDGNIDADPNYVLQRLYDNNTKISTDEAKTVQVISAVVLALLRNTSTTSFEYNTRDVSVKLQTYNTSELSGRRSVTNMIENSSIASQGLHHPNIVQYLGRTLRERYIVMEYMEDETLHHLLSSQPRLSVDRMFTIRNDVGSKGLSYISSMGMVHVSVVPSKILLSGMTLKLNCFSCIAPEVIEEKRHRASGHVYNVGVLLWSMVTGSHYLYDTAREGRDVKVAVDKTMDEKEIIERISKHEEEE
ncbi:putative leucine-rich repeat receptor-like protein kinase [Planoprotostelium fungivorum]|uniref:Putative leucine-rich repeat receptor-like protein kinase n=1 Tax=Planoprotostelium fungivorum TaxID=1890364 RepID=A0A2P6NNW6_9EUKA|nr:putative leucine-rich repeat receptor-like protein kinase [Planoprotostelium fungivorum]